MMPTDWASRPMTGPWGTCPTRRRYIYVRRLIFDLWTHCLDSGFGRPGRGKEGATGRTLYEAERHAPFLAGTRRRT